MKISLFLTLLFGYMTTVLAGPNMRELQLRREMAHETSEAVLRDSVLMTESLSQESLGTIPTDCHLEPEQEHLRYIVVGISGFGTGEEGRGQPSGAHDNLPMHESIVATHRLTHGGSWGQYQTVIDQFQCQGGVQGEPHLRLVIMANSWGAGKATKLAKRYAEACGRAVELFVMVDGVTKPIPGPYRRLPIANRCVNYYQTRSTIRGGAIEGCENHNLDDECSRGGLAHCHIVVEWSGSRQGADLMRDLMN